MNKNEVKQKKQLLILGILFCAVVIGAPSAASAQGFLGNDVTLEISSPFPEAYERIEVRLTSFSVDLNRANIAWSLDGVLQTQGIGIRDFQFTTDAIGMASDIEIVIRTADGSAIVKRTVIRPTSVDILWQAHAYTPPFYKGKALAPSEGFIKFVAIPHLVTGRKVRLHPGELVYTWQQQGVTLGNASGYGRDSIVLEAESVPQQPLVVSVAASSFDRGLEAQKTVRVRVRNPQIIFYEKHPLEGVRYERAMDDTSVFEKEEITIRAEPYFFSLDDMVNNQLEYEWRIDNDIITPLGGKDNEITFRQEGGGAGRARVSLSIENNNLDKILQEAFRAFTIIFGS